MLSHYFVSRIVRFLFDFIYTCDLYMLFIGDALRISFTYIIRKRRFTRALERLNSEIANRSKNPSIIDVGIRQALEVRVPQDFAVNKEVSFPFLENTPFFLMKKCPRSVVPPPPSQSLRWFLRPCRVLKT